VSVVIRQIADSYSLRGDQLTARFTLHATGPHAGSELITAVGDMDARLRSLAGGGVSLLRGGDPNSYLALDHAKDALLAGVDGGLDIQGRFGVVADSADQERSWGLIRDADAAVREMFRG
jgi:hypothetical protein